MSEITLLEELKLLEEKFSLEEKNNPETDISEWMKVFDDCDWSNRQSVVTTLARYIGRLSLLLWGSGFSVEKIVELAEDLSAAILEDIEVYDYSLHLWNENMLKNSEDESYDMEEERKIKKLVESIYDGEIDNSGHGIAKYTIRYALKKEEKLKLSMLNDKKKLDAYVGKDLYKKIYPVFWLEMLNRNRTKETDDVECLVEPVRMETEKEQYLFALLLDKRTIDISNNTIFSGIQRLYTAQYKREKVEINHYDMRNEIDRFLFVREIKHRLLCEETDGNKNKTIFINNIVTVRELIEIGGEGKLDIPAFIFLLDRLTGWIEFYNFVLLGEGTRKICVLKTNDEEKKELEEIRENNNQTLDDLLARFPECVEKEEIIEVACDIAKYVGEIRDIEFELSKDDEEQPDYAAFKNLLEFNHIAFLYVWGKKYLGKNEHLKEAYHTILGKTFIEFIAEAYNKVIENRKYVQEDRDLSKKCIYYRKLYDELFVNEISRIKNATRMDGLNFYDTYYHI